MIENLLIDSLGPSASGKTYWAKNIIKILQKLHNDKFKREKYLSIDGGVYRETSMVFTATHKAAQICGIIGISNLSRLHDSEKIKKKIMGQLDNLKEKKNSAPFNLYVPETLVSCLKTFGCNNLLDTYKNYSCDSDNWTALHLYQHHRNEECSYKINKNNDSKIHPLFECHGIKKSVSAREVRRKKSAQKFKNIA